jgi:hypothetical protein
LECSRRFGRTDLIIRGSRNSEITFGISTLQFSLIRSVQREAKLLRRKVVAKPKFFIHVKFFHQRTTVPTHKTVALTGQTSGLCFFSKLLLSLNTGNFRACMATRNSAHSLIPGSHGFAIAVASRVSDTKSNLFILENSNDKLTHMLYSLSGRYVSS